MNVSKSAYIIFTTRHVTNTQIIINDESISTTNNVKYLEIHLDKRMTWKAHVTAKSGSETTKNGLITGLQITINNKQQNATIQSSYNTHLDL